jgi:23S rRNA pseudouridine1911/1915/1917 synthase
LRRVAEAAETLLDLLRRRFPEASTTTLRKMLQHDRVLVNGAAERQARRPVTATDRVEVLPRHARPLDPRLRVLHADDDLLVVEKAAGLLSVAPEQGGRHDTAEALLDAYVGAPPGQPRVHHVHRLDRDTSGVLVFARGEYMRDQLQALFKVHDIEREYVAIVHGRLAMPAGSFQSFLAEGPDLRVRRVHSANLGKEAITRYAVEAAGTAYSRLALTLQTGRRHQIRVQLADAGHPVLGDRVYGERREDPLGRLALHARKLSFAHPRSGKTMSFTAEEPPAFRTLPLDDNGSPDAAHRPTRR